MVLVGRMLEKTCVFVTRKKHRNVSIANEILKGKNVNNMLLKPIINTIFKRPFYEGNRKHIYLFLLIYRNTCESPDSFHINLNSYN